MAASGASLPQTSHILSIERSDHAVSRVGPGVLRVEVRRRAGDRANSFGYLLRREPVAVGDRFEMGLFTLAIDAVDELGVTDFRAAFAKSLDDPAMCLLEWRGGELGRFSLAPGETRVIPHEPGPTGT